MAQGALEAARRLKGLFISVFSEALNRRAAGSRLVAGSARARSRGVARERPRRCGAPPCVAPRIETSCFDDVPPNPRTRTLTGLSAPDMGMFLFFSSRPKSRRIPRKSSKRSGRRLPRREDWEGRHQCRMH